jgi:hypothetical protein
LKQAFDLRIAVLLSQLSGNVPVIQDHAAIYGLLELTQLLVALHSIVGHTSQLESVCKLVQKWIIFRDFLDYLGQTVVVFQHGEGFY